MDVKIFMDLESLSKAAAEIFIHKAKMAIEDHDRFCVALSGGKTPQRTYELLSLKPFRDLIPWDKTHVFWSDERCVPKDNFDSNSFMAQTILLNHVPIPTQNIHPINCSGNPQISVKEYDDFLHSYFPIDAPNFDLVLLGLGADGHIASVFPNNLKESEESKKWVTSVKIPGNEVQRVTFTIPFINHANSVFILVSGKEKAPILKRVLGNPKENDYLPALLIKPESQELHWMIDEPAAALLDRTSININYF